MVLFVLSSWVCLVLPELITQDLSTLSGRFRNKGNRLVRGMAPICLFWGLWMEQNQRTFKGKELYEASLRDYSL
jgi:hypothetical protein